MAQTVSSHQLGAISTPANNADIVSSVVRGNFQSTRTTLNAHDADSGVHLQSSVAGSKPTAGTAGRKWLETDTLKVFFDTGSVWSEIAYAPTVSPTFTGTATFANITMSGTIVGTGGGGLTVPSGGATITAGGLTITDGGLTVSAGAIALSGAVTFNENISLSTAQAANARHDAGNTAIALTLNWHNGNIQKCVMTGNCVFTFSNPVAGAVYLVECLQDATGSRTATWPATVKWDNSTAPTLTTTANRKDVFTFVWNGTSYLGGVFGQNFTDTV